MPIETPRVLNLLETMAHVVRVRVVDLHVVVVVVAVELLLLRKAGSKSKENREAGERG
jgi:hypothetical protein